MTLAGIELRYLVTDIGNKVKDYYVSNIYGVSRTSILFKLHHPEKPEILLMFSTFGLWVTNVKINQIEENRLVKRLRNDLLRTKISEIKQLGSERIAYITFSGFNQDFVLVGEFFGDGNIILCNKEMKILSLLHSIEVRHRKLSVGLTYIPPPASGLDIFGITKKDIEPVRSAESPVVRWIGRTLGLPTKYAEEIVRNANVNPQALGNTLSEQNIDTIFSSVRDLLHRVTNGIHDPCIIHGEKNADVSPILITNTEGTVTKVSSFMEGLDSLFSENLLEQGKSSQSNTVTQKIVELEHKLEEQNKAIALVKERSGMISTVAKALLDIAGIGITSIQDPTIPTILGKHNSELRRESGILFIDVSGEKIKIDPQSSIQAIASTLFNESKKQMRAIDTIDIERKKTEKNLDAFRKQATVARDSVVFSIQKKREWYERYRWFFTSDGLLAIGGRDASSNSSVIRKHLNKNDKVFHAEIVGSPFFILREGHENTSSITEVAQATVCFSRAWREGLYGLNAYWIHPDQVKTAAPSGQFLAKGSFVIEGTKNFVQVSTMQLAIGLYQKNDEDYSLMCGPVSAIKKNCIYYVVIEPSGVDMVEIAKKIRLEFLKFKDKEDVVKAFNIDDFTRVVPAGDSHIVTSGVGQAYY